MVDMTPKFSGEPTAQALANGLATLGRYGDNYMVHAAEGETVVPGEILDANPQLRESLFTQMKAMGIEDPNRYVVGSDLNSINPITGQPEFFFKKIFKAIRSVAKKAAPLAAAAVGNFLFPGIGGPIGAGLFTKATGGSFGDALKSAGLAYAGQSLLRGAQGFQDAPAGEGIGGFFSGVQQGAMEPFQAASNLFSSGPKNPISQGIFGRLSDGTAGFNMDTFFPSYDPNASGVAGGRITPKEITFDEFIKKRNYQPPSPNQIDAARLASFDPKNPGKILTERDIAQNLVAGGSEQGFVPTDPKVAEAFGSTSSVGGSGIGQKIKEVLTSKEFLGPAAAAGIPAVATFLLSESEDPTEEQLAQLTDPQREAYERLKSLPPGSRSTPQGQALLRQSGITAFYTPEQLARIAGITLEQAKAYHEDKFGAPFAAGGEIIGPGSGTSDSIPAMLSDGEFVMTAEAVRNAGGGDRDLGAARMYDTMNRLERAV